MKYNSTLYNALKNSIQFLTGFSLYLLTYGEFNLIKLIISLTSFLITYNTIYIYNDLMDYKKDKRNKFKKMYKPIASGKISTEQAITLMFIQIIIGLLLSTLINTWYTILLLTLLLQNFLHSSPKTRKIFKQNKKAVIINMTLMQAIKFTLGWFAFTSDLKSLPHVMILTLSLAYTWSYIVYKKDIKRIKRLIKNQRKMFLPLTSLIIILYITSLFIYPYKIPLITMPIIIVILLIRPLRINNKINRLFKLMSASIIIFIILNLLLVSLTIPAVKDINNKTEAIFSKASNITLRMLDNNTYEAIYKINNTIHNYTIKDLNELSNLINLSNKELIISIQ